MAQMRSSSPIRNETQLLLEQDLSLEDLKDHQRNFRIDKPTPLARSRKLKERVSFPATVAEVRNDQSLQVLNHVPKA